MDKVVTTYRESNQEKKQRLASKNDAKKNKIVDFKGAIEKSLNLTKNHFVFLVHQYHFHKIQGGPKKSL